MRRAIFIIRKIEVETSDYFSCKTGFYKRGNLVSLFLVGPGDGVLRCSFDFSN
jgi:hypothetical protein